MSAGGGEFRAVRVCLQVVVSCLSPLLEYPLHIPYIELQARHVIVRSHNLKHVDNIMLISNER